MIEDFAEQMTSFDNLKGKNVVVFVSAIFPSVEFGVKIDNAEQRLQDTIDSLTAWSVYKGKNCVGEIVPNDLSREKLALIKDTYKSLEIDYLILRLSKAGEERCRSFGTGYSELLSIKYFLDITKFKSIVKVSARYCPYAPSFQIKRFLNNGYCCTAFVVFQRKLACAFVISFSTAVFSQNYELMLGQINDRKGVYLEHVFFKFIFSVVNSKRLRLPFLLRFPNYSGSNGKRIDKMRQFKMWLGYALL